METYRVGLDDFLQHQVHPVVTIDQMPIERLSILQLHEHGMALCRIEQPER